MTTDSDDCMNWTEERKDEFRRYWFARLTNTQIAELMPCSRDYVALQARRMGLPDRDIRNDGWTREKIAELKKLWAEGLSTRVIAMQIGMSRNSTIGKAHRLGLEGRKKEPSATPRKRSRKRAAPASPPARILASISGPPLSPIPKVEAPPLAPVDNGQIGVLLLDLEYDRCKWPIGESPSGHTFCGRKAMGGMQPYCKCHARMAYQPERRRAA